MAFLFSKVQIISKQRETNVSYFARRVFKCPIVVWRIRFLFAQSVIETERSRVDVGCGDVYLIVLRQITQRSMVYSAHCGGGAEVAQFEDTVVQQHVARLHVMIAQRCLALGIGTMVHTVKVVQSVDGMTQPAHDIARCVLMTFDDVIVCAFELLETINENAPMISCRVHCMRSSTSLYPSLVMKEPKQRVTCGMVYGAQFTLSFAVRLHAFQRHRQVRVLQR